MPSRSPRVPSYRLHKPSGRAVVRLDGDDHYLGPFQSEASRREYDRLIERWLAIRNSRAASNHPAPTLGGLTVNELLAEFLAYAEDYYRKQDGSAPEYDLLILSLRPLRRLHGPEPIDQFGPLALKGVRQAMVESGLCRNEVNRRVARIVRMFRWGVEQELIDPMVHHALAQVRPLQRGRSAARESVPVQPVDSDRVNAVLPHVSRQVRAMIELQLLTGMRPGEVVQMRSRDIDRQGEVWVYHPATHKTEHLGRPRRVYLGPKSQRILVAWLREDLDAPLFSPAEAQKERRVLLRSARKTKVQPSQQNRRKDSPARSPGAHYTPTSYYRAIQRGCDSAGVPRWHPNQLRHTAATRIRQKFGIEAASVLLGHSEVGVTQVYAERDEGLGRRVAVAEG